MVSDRKSNEIYITAPKKRGYVVSGFIVVFLIFGSWISFRYSFASWSPDSDIAVTVALWRGIIEHGLSFVTTWHYTQDNWLLSLVLPLSIIYSLVGPHVAIAVGWGWGVFMGSIVTTSYLAYRIAGRKAAFATAIILSFPNFSNVDGVGFLTYTITHTTSMAWALLAVVVALYAIERRSALGIIVTGICIFINFISDPWAGAGIAIPLVIAASIVAAINWNRPGGHYVAAVGGVSIVAVLATETRLFGVLGFLPPTEFHITDPVGMASNIGWMFRVLAIDFSVVPGRPESAIIDIMSFAAMAVALMSAIVGTIKRFRDLPIGSQLTLATAILSMAGITAAFILNAWAQQPALYVGRFFPNFFYFGTLLVVVMTVHSWTRLASPLRLAVIAYAALLVATGIASKPALWTSVGPRLVTKSTRAMAIGSFLEKHSLTYGYGPYWGAETDAMDWFTHGRVTIRPVIFNQRGIRPLTVEVSDLWYSPEDQPAGDRTTFLVMTDTDGSCPSVSSCVATATHQFGTPARQLTYRKWTILVWNHPIVKQLVGQ